MSIVTTLKNHPILSPLTVDSNQSNPGWKTIIFNCYCHELEEVALQIMRATRYSHEKSTMITLTAHNSGSALVCEGSQEYCEKIASMLGGVGLKVTVIQ